MKKMFLNRLIVVSCLSFCLLLTNGLSVGAVNDNSLFLGNDNGVREPIGHLCDPFCIVDKEDGEVFSIFEDMDSSHKNAFAIRKFYEEGFIRGYGDGTFKPNSHLNRVELLAVVLDTIDADFGGQVLENCFKDVGKEWYSAYVCYAKNNGIVNGYKDGTFRPGRKVTKAEALKITLESFGFDASNVLNTFVSEHLDVSETDWFAPYIHLAKNANIVSKMGRFGPNDPIERGEFVQLVYNTMFYRSLIK